LAGLLTKVWVAVMGEILDAFTKAFDADRPDILDRLYHSQPLARGPYRRLIDDSITEIERLRLKIGTNSPIYEDSEGVERNSLGNRNDHADELVGVLRDRACPSGLPYTGDNPKEDHGHTDCWLHHQAADEIERLRALITEWADTFDVYPEVHEPDWHDRWDAANDALRKAVGR
jgi:hypothetical protein